MHYDIESIPTTTDQGRTRRVGFELEFAGVDLKRLAERIAEELGGKVESENAFVHTVAGTRLGDFQLEVDADLLKKRRYRDFLQKIGIILDQESEKAVENALLETASVAVPFELVSPPVPLDRMHEMDALERILRELGAKGTRASPLYAFGMQLNPEAPSLGADSVRAHIQAFLLLEKRLRDEIDVDPSRRIAPFIDNFPDSYRELVLDPDYAPDMDSLVADYLEHNPTRNRPLDMTCLFAHLDPDTVLKKVEEPHLVKPRPTYHYRLPDCRIDDPDWSMALEWNRWAMVERLAADSEELARQCRDYAQRPKSPLDWLRRLGKRLAP
jgi:hypothetical protein